MTARPPTRGPQQWSTFRKPACRNGRDAGAAPAGSTIGLYAQATTREPRRSGLCRLRKQQGEGLAAPSTFRHGGLVDPLGSVPRVVQVQALGAGATLPPAQPAEQLHVKAKVSGRSPNDQLCSRRPPELARLTGRGRCGRSLQAMNRITKMRPMTKEKVQHCRWRSPGRAREWSSWRIKPLESARSSNSNIISVTAARKAVSAYCLPSCCI
jgi:hypothetical protein